MINIGINGFGRIGRMVFRIALHDPDVNVVAINDITDTKTLAHLLKYDSVHLKYDMEVGCADHGIVVKGQEFHVYSERDPANIPWGKHNVDVVVECTGFFTKRSACEKHLQAGAKKVLLSAPGKKEEGKEPIRVIVRGVNEHTIMPGETILSNASCTTNCLAPIVKVLNDNYGIEHGFMTTVHSYTADQRLVDAPHQDLRRARSAAISQIPTTTGAAKTVTEVIPELKGKLDGIAIRVPTPDGSVTDFVCVVKKDVTKEQINALFKSVAENELKGVIEYTEDPIVSADVIHNPHSSVFDSALTNVIEKRLVKIIAWYDNEWGYSNRMLDIVKRMK